MKDRRKKKERRRLDERMASLKQLKKGEMKDWPWEGLRRDLTLPV